MNIKMYFTAGQIPIMLLYPEAEPICFAVSDTNQQHATRTLTAQHSREIN